MDLKQKRAICCVQETHFRLKDTHRLQEKGWEKIFHSNGNQRKAKVAILVRKKKKDFKSKTVLEMKKVTPYLTRQGPVQQGHVTITNIYTSNIRKPKWVKQILTNIKGEIDRNTIVVKIFSTPLLINSWLEQHYRARGP